VAGLVYKLDRSEKFHHAVDETLGRECTLLAETMEMKWVVMLVTWFGKFVGEDVKLCHD